MKSFLAILLAGSALCAAALETQTTYPHVPLVLWSPTRATFEQTEVYSSDVLDENRVSETLQRVLASTAAEKAQVLCLFLSPTLETSALDQLAVNGKTSFVATAVKTAKSSIVMPHTTREGSLEGAFKEAKVDDAAHVVSDVKAWMVSTEGKELLSNDKTDLVIVKTPAGATLADIDALIQKTVETLGDVADYAFTGNAADKIVTTQAQSRRLDTPAGTPAITCDVGYQIGVDASGKPYCFGHYVRMTPNLLSGIVIGIFFVFLGYIGFSAMHGIQTPTRYPHHGPPKGKEF